MFTDMSGCYEADQQKFFSKKLLADLVTEIVCPAPWSLLEAEIQFLSGTPCQPEKFLQASPFWNHIFAFFVTYLQTFRREDKLISASVFVSEDHVHGNSLKSFAQSWRWVKFALRPVLSTIVQPLYSTTTAENLPQSNSRKFYFLCVDRQGSFFLLVFPLLENDKLDYASLYRICEVRWKVFTC